MHRGRLATHASLSRPTFADTKGQTFLPTTSGQTGRSHKSAKCAGRHRSNTTTINPHYTTRRYNSHHHTTRINRQNNGTQRRHLLYPEDFQNYDYSNAKQYQSRGQQTPKDASRPIAIRCGISFRATKIINKQNPCLWQYQHHSPHQTSSATGHRTQTKHLQSARR